MADLSLDLNEESETYLDLLIIDGDLVLTSDVNPLGSNPILQQILQELRFGLGEWFLDSTQGFPWIQQVFVKAPDFGKIDALIQNLIMGVPGVDVLTSYSSKQNAAARGLNISFVAETTSGTVSYSGTISPTSGG